MSVEQAQAAAGATVVAAGVDHASGPIPAAAHWPAGAANWSPSHPALLVAAAGDQATVPGSAAGLWPAAASGFSASGPNFSGAGGGPCWPGVRVVHPWTAGALASQVGVGCLGPLAAASAAGSAGVLAGGAPAGRPAEVPVEEEGGLHAGYP